MTPRIHSVAYTLVPREPTDAMVEAGAQASWLTGTDWDSPEVWADVPEYAQDYHRDRVRCAWTAMIAAHEVGQ